MQKREIPFSPPDITDAEIEEVVAALRSGWITTGPRTKELERRVADRCHTSNAVCLNSNTACAELTLRALGVGEGDEVIVPAYTYTATASVALHVGATLKMVDCAPDAFTMDYDALGAAITERTKVIVPVDLFGIPCDYDRIFKIVEEKRDLFRPSDNAIQKAIGRVIVMADAAHAYGATYKGMPIGSVADFTNFSFHAVKNLTTAEGGAVTWRDIPDVDNDELYHLYQLMSLHGQSKDALHKTQLGAWEYDIVAPWYKCNMTDVHAAIGLSQDKRYDQMLQRRRDVIARYNEGLANLPITPVDHFHGEFQGSGHLYAVNLDGYSENDRNAFIVEMAKLGVATNVHYKPLPMHTGYKEPGFDIADYPNAYEHYKNEVTFPLTTVLTDEDVEYVIWAAHESFKALGW